MNYKYLFNNLIWGLSIALYILLPVGCKKAQPLPDHTVLYEKFNTSEKLEFASMAITKTARFDDTKWYSGKKIAVYSYDTYLKAYIDLSEFDAENLVFNEVDKTAALMLPPVRIEVAGRDMNMRKVYDNVGLLRRPIDSKQRAEIKEQANESLMKELKNNPEYLKKLKESARKKAESYFGAILQNEGYTPTVSFKDESDFTDIVSWEKTAD